MWKDGLLALGWDLALGTQEEGARPPGFPQWMDTEHPEALERLGSRGPARQQSRPRQGWAHGGVGPCGF